MSFLNIYLDLNINSTFILIKRYAILIQKHNILLKYIVFYTKLIR